MPDLHNQAVSSTVYSNLRSAIRDAIDDSIAQILQFQDDAVPLAPECVEQVERQTREVCMDLGRRVLQRILEDGDAHLPDAIKQDDPVLRRWKVTPKMIAPLLGSMNYRRARHGCRSTKTCDWSMAT